MYKFFIASDLMLEKQSREKVYWEVAYIYMVKRWTIAIPFNEIEKAMRDTFISLDKSVNKFWYWYTVDFEELENEFWIKLEKWSKSFELKKWEFLI